MDTLPCRLDTFLRWTNYHLREAQFRSPLPPERRVVTDLSSGLSDGVLLAELCGSLMRLKEPIKIHYQPRVRSRKIENIHTCLSVMQEQGVRVQRIGPEDVLRGDPEVLAGILWSMIVRYQLSGDTKRSGSKKSVLLWIRSVLPSENIPDLATSWNNGMFLYKLISYLSPTHSSLNHGNHAMLIFTAKRELGVEDILSAESLSSCSLDEESLATYLSLFLVAMTTSLVVWLRGLLGSSAPRGLSPEDWRNGDLLGRLVLAKCPEAKRTLRDLSEMFSFLRDMIEISPIITARELREGKVDLISLQTFLLQIKNARVGSVADNCSAVGRGITSCSVGVTSSFTVNTQTAGRGQLIIEIKYDKGEVLDHSINHNNKIISVIYKPSRSGVLYIAIKWSGEHIPNSPYRILVTDPTAVKLVENIHEEIQVSKEYEVLVSTDGAGEGVLTGQVIYSNNISIHLTSVVRQNGIRAICIHPKDEGDITLHILWDNVPIRGSPLKLSAVLPPSYHLDAPRDPETGHLPGVKVGEAICLCVRSKQGRLTQLSVEAKHSETGLPLSVATETHRNYSYVWVTPDNTGMYKISLLAGEIHIAGSPVLLPVSDANQLILLSPSCLPNCMQIGCPMKITLTAATAGPAQLHFNCDRGIDCQINRTEDTIVATLLPGSLGEFVCSLKWGTDHIPNSPFRVRVCDITQVSVSGTALEGELGVVGEELEFIILYELAGVCENNDITIKVSARGPTAEYIVATQEEGLGHTVATFTPWESGEHELEVLLGDIQLENSPFYLEVIASDSMNTHAYGTGLQRAVSGTLSEFYIRSKHSDVLESGRLGVKVHSIHGEVQHWLVERGEGDYKVEYTPKRPGAYLVEVSMDGDHISGSPFKVSCHQNMGQEDTDCLLSGPALNPDMKFTLGQPVDFTVDATSSPASQLSVSAVCEVNQLTARVIMHQYRQGFYQVNIDPPEVGVYSVSVRYGDKQSADSPFFVEIVPSDTDPSQCRAYGPGLHEAMVGDRTEFFVSTHSAGRGALAVSVEGFNTSLVVYVDPTPEDTKLLCCRYKPKSSGSFIIALKWSGVHIPGSPYRLDVKGIDLSGGSRISLQDSLADSMRHAQLATEGYVSSEDDTLAPDPPVAPSPIVTPLNKVAEVAEVAEDTPTAPKGRVLAHISHFEKQVSVEDPVVPKRASEGWKYLRAISEKTRDSEIHTPERKIPVIPESKVAQDKGVNKVAQLTGVPLEDIKKGVVSSLVKKSEQLTQVRNIFDSPSLRNLREGAHVRRTREQLTELSSKNQSPVKPAQISESADKAKVAINRTDKSKDRIRLRRSADRSKSKDIEEDKSRRKDKRKDKGKKVPDSQVEKNVSFSAEVATHHIPKDKQKTGIFGIFDKKESKHRKPVVVHRTIQTGSVPASIHQQQKAAQKYQQYSAPYIPGPYPPVIPRYYPQQYVPMPQYIPAPQRYPSAMRQAAVKPPRKPPGHYMEDFAEQTNLFY
ncbi:Filamin-B-like [Oopsacas minuta]|uniref:Filamin-B-like n=1 Tax=Oopsacas minuta TaxID=111878 RepID=A0AAV7J8J4_9METZ|nr:Filamin-B-like [Oopsacas minuta]